MERKTKNSLRRILAALFLIGGGLFVIAGKSNLMDQETFYMFYNWKRTM